LQPEQQQRVLPWLDEMKEGNKDVWRALWQSLDPNEQDKVLKIWDSYGNKGEQDAYIKEWEENMDSEDKIKNVFERMEANFEVKPSLGGMTK